MSLACVAVIACGETYSLSVVERVCAHTPLVSNVTASADKPRKFTVRTKRRNKPAIGLLLSSILSSNGLGADRGQNMAGHGLDSRQYAQVGFRQYRRWLGPLQTLGEPAFAWNATAIVSGYQAQQL